MVFIVTVEYRKMQKGFLQILRMLKLISYFIREYINFTFGGLCLHLAIRNNIVL